MDSHIGKLIQQHRKELGLTREKLAVSVGCSMGSIVRWETGKGTPRDIYIKSLERVLKTRLSNT